ncbi:MAG: D-alanyl-D-alanine carboxypeptidase family protein, partial [Clostridia bacterium]|nr:D-alanyl-D-alanine carboxypeptidase family protein [Clostridia bacterium]
KGKEAVTGIIWEPWHYRYVGINVALAVSEGWITLEEYLEEN